MFIRQYRNEWKYICRENDLAILDSRLAAILDKDIHSGKDGKYDIHSLYFDDHKDTCARENDAGISRRFKYRIRYYGKQSNILTLERKEKLDGRCYKESCYISVDQYGKIFSGDVDEVLWETDNLLLKRFCIHCMTRGFAPKAIVDYQRVAYVETVTNIRVTLDENITVSDEVSQFLTGNYLRIPLQEQQRHVLEVKFDSIFPSHISILMTNQNLIQTAFSKYYLGRQKLQQMGRR